MKTFLSNMRHIKFLRYFCLLAKHKLALGTVMLRHLVVGSFVVAYETSTCHLLPQDPNLSVTVIMRRHSRRINLLDLGCCHFPVIFELDCDRRSHQPSWVKEKYSYCLSSN